MPQVDADARHDALLERILIDGFAALVEMQGSIDMGAAMVGHGEIHRGEPVHLAAVRKGFLVRLPHPVDDGGVAGIVRRAMITLAAEVDDLHERSFLAFQFFLRHCEERSSEAIHMRARPVWIASLTLAMTDDYTGMMPALAMTSCHFGTSAAIRWRKPSAPLAMTSKPLTRSCSTISGFFISSTDFAGGRAAGAGGGGAGAGGAGGGAAGRA